MASDADTLESKPRRRPGRMARWLRWGLFVAVVVGAVVWFTRPLWYGVAVVVVAPTRGAIAETVVSSGRVLAPSTVAVGSTIVGAVERVAVDEGERVAAGQVLVVLADAEASAALARAEAALAGVAAAQDELDERGAPAATEALRQANANLAQAEIDFARDTGLARDGALPEADLQRTKTALTLARSRVRAALVELRSARPAGTQSAAITARATEAEAAVEAAKARLALHTLTAPVAGVVLRRDVEPGVVVQPGAPLIVLAEAGQDRLVIEPDEKNLRVLVIGQRAVASADAFPDRRFAATVSWIAPVIDPRRGTVEVHLALDGPQGHLKADMTVSVEIEVAKKDDALVLPRDVVRDLATDAPWVLVVDGAHAQKRSVTLGLRGDASVEVASGLEPDARVIRPNPTLPAIGARVRVPEPSGE